MGVVHVRRHVAGDPRGVTLIEVMIVVVVLGILAAIALPAWTKDSMKSKARSETNAFLSEIAAKEEQYHQDNGVYLDTSASTCPSATSSSGSASTSCFLSTPWSSLRIAPPEQYSYCTYYVKTGAAGVNPSPPIGTLNATPATTWFWILATCDMDGSSSVNSQYLTSNLDNTIQKANEGQ